MTAACPECVRHCRLLAELGPLLDYRTSRPQDLAELLGLGDQELIEALGGRRRAQLRDWHRSREAGRMEPCRGGIQLCRHDQAYPVSLHEPWAPAVLSVLGGRERFAELIGRPAVAFLDAPEASDYGRAMAASLARGLAAAGVTIVAGVRGPLGRAVHAVASRAGTSLAVLGEGLATVRGRAEATLRLVLDGGCAVSELPWRSAARKWGPVACERIVTGLGAATVVVESRGEERELWAGRLGGPLGAVPGMVTNPLACGPHRLLAGGARRHRHAGGPRRGGHRGSPAWILRSRKAARGDGCVGRTGGDRRVEPDRGGSLREARSGPRPLALTVVTGAQVHI